MAFGSEEDTSLAGFIAAMRMMEGNQLSIDVAETAVDTVRDSLTRTLSAGKGPEGEPWAPNRRRGDRAYPGAEGSLTVKASGAYLRATVTGPEAFGNFGRTGKQVARPMLPDAGAGMPPSIATALDKATQIVIDRAFK